jgi:hypothetical protein
LANGPNVFCALTAESAALDRELLGAVTVPEMVTGVAGAAEPPPPQPPAIVKHIEATPSMPAANHNLHIVITPSSFDEVGHATKQ